MGNAYAKLADFIEKYPKQIIIVWIVALLVTLPIGIHTFTDDDVLSYDMTNMVDDNYESVQGLQIIGDPNYFQSGTGMDVIVVLDVPASEQSKIASFVQSFNAQLAERYGTTDTGAPKVTAQFLQYMTASGEEDGIGLVSVMFPADWDTALSNEIETVRSAVSAANTEGLTTYVTGSSAISHDTEVGAMTDIERIDPFTILLILILIGLFFRSFISAATPPVVIGFAYGLVLTVIYGIAHVLDVYYISSTIVLVAMLGAGCDYCIFILARYREERKKGLDHSAAIKESVTWAGESITTSGISVIIGFGAMSICSFSMISTMGIILASGVVLALLAALTFIPAVIALAGDRIFYPTTVERLNPDGKIMQGWYGKFSRLGERYFKSSAEHATKYAVPIVLAAILVTVPLAYVATSNEGSYDMIGTMPAGEAKEGVEAITDTGNGGLIMPTYVLLELEQGSEPLFEVKGENDLMQMANDGEISRNLLMLLLSLQLPQMDVGFLVWTDIGMKYVEATTGLANNIQSSDDNIASVTPLYSFAYMAQVTAQSSGTDVAHAAIAVIQNESMFDYLGDEMKGSLINLIQAGIDAGLGNDMVDFVGMIIDYEANTMLGTTSSVYDGKQYIRMTVTTVDEPMSNKSMDSITGIIGIVDEFDASETGKALFTASFVTGSVAATHDIAQIVNNEFTMIELLVVVLIFLLLFFVMKSYITPIRAIVTIAMSIVWTLGLTFIVFEGLLGVPVSFIMPIILFVICLGLGMDYDILLTTRIKENVSKGMDNDTAIKEAIHKSGSVITICGLIMAGAFGTMMLSTSPMLQEIGFALCFAIAVDALIVRTYIVPAVMHLLGRWNWVGPKSLQEGTFRFTRHNTGYIGMFAVALFAVCVAGAAVLGGVGLQDLGMHGMLELTGTANTLMGVGTLGTAVLLLLLGYAYSRSREDAYGTATGALIVLTGVMMALSTILNVGSLPENLFWAATFGIGILAVIVQAVRYAKEGSSFTAGLLAMVLIACAAAALSGALFVSTAMMAACMAGILVVSLHR